MIFGFDSGYCYEKTIFKLYLNYFVKMLNEMR